MRGQLGWRAAGWDSTEPPSTGITVRASSQHHTPRWGPHGPDLSKVLAGLRGSSICSLVCGASRLLSIAKTETQNTLAANGLPLEVYNRTSYGAGVPWGISSRAKVHCSPKLASWVRTFWWGMVPSSIARLALLQ